MLWLAPIPYCQALHPCQKFSTISCTQAKVGTESHPCQKFSTTTNDRLLPYCQVVHPQQRLFILGCTNLSMLCQKYIYNKLTRLTVKTENQIWKFQFSLLLSCLVVKVGQTLNDQVEIIHLTNFSWNLEFASESWMRYLDRSSKANWVSLIGHVGLLKFDVESWMSSLNYSDWLGVLKDWVALVELDES